LALRSDERMSRSVSTATASLSGLASRADLGVMSPLKRPANPDFLEADSPRFRGVSEGPPASTMTRSSSWGLLERRLSRLGAGVSGSSAPTMTISSSSGETTLRAFFLLLDLSTPRILAALDDISGSSSGGGDARPCMSTEWRRDDDFPLMLARLSRVDMEREMGGVLVNMLDIRTLPGVFSALSARSALSEPESFEEDLSADRFDVVLSVFGLDEDLGSSLRGAAFHRAHEAASSFILGRSFLDGLGSGGGVSGASGTGGGGGGGGGASSAADLDLLFLLFFLSFAAMSTTTAWDSSSSSSAGKLPGSSDDLWLFLDEALSCSASSASLDFFLDLELFLSSFNGAAGGGGGGGGTGSAGGGSGAASNDLSLSAILPPTGFRVVAFIEKPSVALPKGVVSLASVASSRTAR